MTKVKTITRMVKIFRIDALQDADNAFYKVMKEANSLGLKGYAVNSIYKWMDTRDTRIEYVLKGANKKPPKTPKKKRHLYSTVFVGKKPLEELPYGEYECKECNCSFRVYQFIGDMQCPMYGCNGEIEELEENI